MAHLDRRHVSGRTSHYMTRGIAGLLLLVGLLMAGCGTTRPDLSRLYGDAAREPKSNPVIVIPGVMGSRLVDTESGEEIWPGSLLDLVTGSNFERLALPLEDEAHRPSPAGIAPGGVFDQFAGRDFYGSLVDTLDGPGRYDCVEPAAMTPETDCVLFSWDWRRDLVDTAGELDALVEQLRELQNNPDLQVDIVAHSAAGLITRYFLRYGAEDVLPRQDYEITNAGARKVRKAILIGTPNFGSISALQQAIVGMDTGLRRIPPEIVATMPGLYQLLPHPDRGWIIDMQGRRVDRDLYEPGTWRRWRWSVFDPEVRERVVGRFDDPAEGERYLQKLERFFAKHLEGGERFHRALSVRQQEPPSTFIVFGGDCHLTPARCALEVVDNRAHMRLYPDDLVDPEPGVDYEKLMLEPGDGSVTKASLMGRDDLNASRRSGGAFPIDFAVFLCEKHNRLTDNMTFRDNLLNILLY